MSAKKKAAAKKAAVNIPVTLRDYIAIKAIQGMLANSSLIGEAGAFHERNIQAAYEMADLILAERDKKR